MDSAGVISLHTHPAEMPADMIPTLNMLFSNQDAACRYKHMSTPGRVASLFLEGRWSMERTKPVEIRKRTPLCISEGMKKEADNTQRVRASTRTGCKVHVRFSKQEDSQWKVIAVELQHNHDLLPTNLSKYLPANRNMSKPHQDLATTLHQSGVPPILIFSTLRKQMKGKDCRNILTSVDDEFFLKRDPDNCLTNLGS